jgi:transcription factor CRZ1
VPARPSATHVHSSQREIWSDAIGEPPRSENATSGELKSRSSSFLSPNQVPRIHIEEVPSTFTNHYGPRDQKQPKTFQCTLCPENFTLAYKFRSHLRKHNSERPFVCTMCGKSFTYLHEWQSHEALHSEKMFVCKGDLKAGGQWGCGLRFACADALYRHFQSELGDICITPLLDEEMGEQERPVM